MMRKPIILVLLYIFFAFSFIIVTHNTKSYLQEPIFALPGTNVNLWSISHIFMYMFIGYLLPNKGFEFMIFGLGFEVLEDYLASNIKTQLINCGWVSNLFASSRIKFIKTFWCHTSSNDTYWYAKWDDIFFNILGYTIGEYVNKLFK